MKNPGHQSTSPDLPHNKIRRQLCPGVWEDLEGGLHFSVPDILAYLDVTDTPENRENTLKLFEELLREQLPNAKIIIRP